MLKFGLKIQQNLKTNSIFVTKMLRDNLKRNIKTNFCKKTSLSKKIQISCSTELS